MLEETTPRTSAGWQPTHTFADDMGMAEKVPQTTHAEVPTEGEKA